MKKNLLTVLILALLVVNIALTAVMMISVTSTNNKTAALVDTIAMVMNLELVAPGEEEEAEAVSLADTAIYTVGEGFTIPLATEKITNADGTTSMSKQSYMVCSVSLSLNTKHADYKKKINIDNISSYEVIIKEEIESVISSHTLDYCTNNRTELQAELLREIQSRLDSDVVYSVSITDVQFG